MKIKNKNKRHEMKKIENWQKMNERESKWQFRNIKEGKKM